MTQNLHQLRHSALQHLAQAGRTAPELQARSRHQHLASLGRYVRLGEEISVRITADADPMRCEGRMGGCGSGFVDDEEVAHLVDDVLRPLLGEVVAGVDGMA